MNAFAALAVDKRRDILTLLSKKDMMSATDISKQFKISAAGISQHLKILRDAQLVTVTKHGQHRLYRINFKGIHDLESWVNHIKQEWEERLDNLNDYVMSLQKKGEHK